MADKLSKARPALQPLGQVAQLGSRVYDSLVSSIVSGHMEFGAPLRLNAIASMLAVSNTPVRDALARLEANGLAVKIPNYGWFVRDFTEDEIRDMHEVRGSIESLSVRLACERMTQEELSELHALQKSGRAAVQSNDSDAYMVYNREFHSLIMRTARNSYLAMIIGQLGPQSEMLTSRSTKVAGRMPRAFEEHANIIDCLSRRDAEGAEKGMKAHIFNALCEFLKFRRAQEVKPRASNEIEEFLLGKRVSIGGNESVAPQFAADASS